MKNVTNSPKFDVMLAILLLLSLATLYHLYYRSDAAVSLLNKLSGKAEKTPETKPKTCTIERLIQLKGNETDPRELCANLVNRQDRTACYQYIGVETSPACEAVEEPEARIFCYNNLSRVEKNPELCNVLYGQYRTECISGCSLNLLRPNLCDVWNTTIDRYICYGKAAGETENTSLCDAKIPAGQIITLSSGELIPSDALLQLCYTSVATYAENRAICDKITDREIRQYCIALSTGDNTSCNSIQDSFHRDKCLRNTPATQEARKFGNPLYPERKGRSYWPIYALMQDNGRKRLW